MRKFTYFFREDGKPYKVLQVLFYYSLLIFVCYALVEEWYQGKENTKGSLTEGFIVIVIVLIRVFMDNGQKINDNKIKTFLIFIFLNPFSVSAQDVEKEKKNELVVGFMNTIDFAKYKKVEGGVYIRPMLGIYGKYTNKLFLYSITDKSFEAALDIKLPKDFLITFFVSKSVKKEHENAHNLNPSYLSFGFEKSIFKKENKKITFIDASFFVEGRKHIGDKKFIPVIGFNLTHCVGL